MVEKYAIIENGVVTNIAVSDAEFAKTQGWVRAETTVSIGWFYDAVTKTFTAPPPPPEDLVTP